VGALSDNKIEVSSGLNENEFVVVADNKNPGWLPIQIKNSSAMNIVQASLK